MSDKDVVLDTVRLMPETATLEQIREEIALLAAIHNGERAADAGKVTPHEEVRKNFSSSFQEQDDGRKQWTAYSLQNLAKAYGNDEPEYTVADLRP